MDLFTRLCFSEVYFSSSCCTCSIGINLLHCFRSEQLDSPAISAQPSKSPSNQSPADLRFTTISQTCDVPCIVPENPGQRETAGHLRISKSLHQTDLVTLRSTTKQIASRFHQLKVYLNLTTKFPTKMKFCSFAFLFIAACCLLSSIEASQG